jgi:hypothetical protein
VGDPTFHTDKVSFRVWRRRLFVVLALTTVYMVAWRITPTADVTDDPIRRAGRSDLSLFKDVVQAVRNGGSYYEVMGSELRARDYAVRSVFNWRLPWMFEVLARVPDWCGRLTLVLLAGVMIVTASRLLRREIFGPLLVINAALPAAAAQSVFLFEIWAGILIGLSALAFANEKRMQGVAWGVTALFVRELAAPYCILAMLIAFREKRWREVAAWCAGGAAYGVMFAVHAWYVIGHIRPGDPAQPSSWLYGGGIPFLLQIWRTNGLFMYLSRPAFAFVVVAIIGSWWSPKMPLHVRSAVMLYSLCFMAVGLPFNTYWGFVLAPLIGIWLSYSYDGFAQLFSAQSQTRQITSPRVLGAAV